METRSPARSLGWRPGAREGLQAPAPWVRSSAERSAPRAVPLPAPATCFWGARRLTSEGLWGWDDLGKSRDHPPLVKAQAAVQATRTNLSTLRSWVRPA